MRLWNFLLVGVWLFTAVSLGAQDWSAEYGMKPWTDRNEAALEALYHSDGYYLALKNTVQGRAPAALLEPYLDRLNGEGLVSSTIRDSLLTLVPPEGNRFLIPLLKRAPAGPGRDFVLARRMNFDHYAFSPFHFSLYPLRMEMLSGTSLILPNYSWEIGEQTDRRQTLVAYEKNFAATVQMVWIPRDTQSALKTTQDLLVYTSFRPGYLVHPPAEDKALTDADLTTIADVPPRQIAVSPAENAPKEVWEQIQTSPDGESFQIYVGRTRYYYFPGKILVLTMGLHTVSTHVLAEKRMLVQKLGQLMDTLKVKQ